MVTGTLRAKPGWTDKEPWGCSAGRLPLPPCAPGPFLLQPCKPTWEEATLPSTAPKGWVLLLCRFSPCSWVTESRTACDLQLEPEEPADPPPVWLCCERDLQSLQYPHSRKEMENTARRATFTLHIPTSQRLVTRNFSPTITSYQGTPCTRDKINITSELAPKDRLD